METKPSSNGSGSTALSSQTSTPYHIHVVVVNNDNNDDKMDAVVVETDYYQDILGSQPADKNESSSRNFVHITRDGVWWMEALHPVPALTDSTQSFSHTM